MFVNKKRREILRIILLLSSGLNAVICNWQATTGLPFNFASTYNFAQTLNVYDVLYEKNVKLLEREKGHN